MKTEDFNFELPEELIARYPLDRRDESRLLHYNLESKSLKHLKFHNIVDLLQKGDLLVRNNTRVLPARLFLEDSLKQIKVEVLLIKPKDERGFVWEIMGKPWKKIKPEFSYQLANGQEVSIELDSDKKKYINFESLDLFKQAIEEAGAMPIPPYMSRDAESMDADRYQTIYAQEASSARSIAAPTAGLHFTEEIFQKLKAKGVEVVDLTLHVGTGTFVPVKTEDITDHEMHPESFSVDEANWSKILKAKEEGRRVISIGSTSTRCLETLARPDQFSIEKNSQSLFGETDIYIYPGFEFKIVNAILTNFHLPKSSLILMVSAFAGREEILKIYKEAIEEKYRFYSYGDCMLLC